MSYPNNPREVRSLIEAVHTSYVRGETLFPRGRLQVEPEQLPEKSQTIARVLMEDWRHIDEDHAFFETSISMMLDHVENGEAESARVITRVGLNAVRWAHIENAETEKVIMYGTLPADEAKELFGNAMVWYGNEDFAYEDGVLANSPPPTLQIVRDGRGGFTDPVVSGVYLTPSAPDFANVA